MNMKNYVAACLGIAALVVIMSGCGHSGYKKTSTGMAYDIIADGKGENLKNGELIKFNIKFLIGDSVVQNTNEHIPGYYRVDSSLKNQYNFTDIITEMKVGDSAVISLSIDTLVKMQQWPASLKYPAGTIMKGYFKIIARYKTESDLEADYKKEEAAELAKEISILEKYLKDNKINATKTPKGTFVEIMNPGTGMQADSGRKVSVLYHGTTLKGVPFDSTKDSAFGHVGKPYEFILGRDPVVEGWVEGLKLLKEGAQAKFYIPAMLAYKNQSQGEVIKPYSDLVFEINLVSVKDGASETPIPMH